METSLEERIKTFDWTITYCKPDEYPFWVTEVQECIYENRIPHGRFASWVSDVVSAIKRRNKTQSSFADSNN